jgi:hypothetical protein
MAPSKEDTMMDFLYGLDNSRYAAFKAEIVNDMQKGILTQPGNPNTMHLLASHRVMVRSQKEGTGGATFALIDEGTKKDGKNPTKHGGKELTKEEKLAKRLARMKCFNCAHQFHDGSSVNDT